MLDMEANYKYSELDDEAQYRARTWFELRGHKQYQISLLEISSEKEFEEEINKLGYIFKSNGELY